MYPFKLPKWLPCEKLMSVANELIPDSAVTLTVLEQSTRCSYSYLVTPFTLTSARNDYEIIFFGTVFEKYFFPFFSFETSVLGNFSETMNPATAVDLIDTGCL